MEQYRVTDIQAMSGLMRISRAIDKSDAFLMAALTTVEAFIAQSSTSSAKESALAKATGLSDDALALPIEALGLSGRAMFALKRGEYEEYINKPPYHEYRKVKTETVGDLLIAGKAKLLKMREFGNTSYKELIAAIDKLRPGASGEPKEISQQARIANMAIPIDELELTVRAHGACEAAGIKTLGELSQTSRRELYYLPNVGKGTLNELDEALAAHGLKFAQEKRRVA